MTICKNIILNGAQDKQFGIDIFVKEDDKLKPVVIYVHGFNGFKDWGNADLFAKQFAENGFAFIKMNFSHNGTTIDKPEEITDLEAFGNNNYSNELYDLEVLINWVLNENNPFQNSMNVNTLSIIGHSRGGGIAIIKASENMAIKKIVTWASVVECKTPWSNWTAEIINDWKTKGVAYYQNKRTNQQLPLYFQLYEDFQKNSKRFDIETAVKKLTQPFLICHGTQDVAVSIEAAFQLKQWNEKANTFFLETDHVFGRRHPWLEKQLPSAMQQIVNRTVLFLEN